MKTKKMKTPSFDRSTPLVYQFTREVRANGSWSESTYDKATNKEITKYSDGFWYEETHDKYGYPATYKDSNGWTCEHMHDKDGTMIASTDSDGNFKIRPSGWSSLKDVNKQEYDAYINAL